MKQFPSNIKFKFDWRKYQQRVLKELEEHLNDDHLHIIAPPGSGKTVLGLEVMLRLNKPTLIFAPTISIKNQWIQRFCELFLQSNQQPEWISEDIKQPKFLTVVTYQALHAACSIPKSNLGKKNLEQGETKSENSKSKKIIALLKEQNVGTIVVDEAHHLKNAWWQSLTEIKNALSPTIVGLTATPPYDVSQLEWQRYIELNGPVDAEISVPELVVEGNLCPHQDYVLFSRPTLYEIQKIDEYRQRIQLLFDEVCKDQTLINALINHPIYTTPNLHLEWIYNNLEYYSATLIFLNEIGKQITQDHLNVIGDKKFIVPKLTYEWIEILLTFYLYKDSDNFKQYKAHQIKLLNKLKRKGAIQRRSINFIYNRKVNKFLSSSISKLKSVTQIVNFEHDQLKKDLRMVILTDYVRKEFLVHQPTNTLDLNKIGVMPIFEQLRRNNNKNVKIGILTGSLVIIPSSAFKALEEIALKNKISHISTTSLLFDKSYLIINTTTQVRQNIVHFITQIFQKGHIEVLISTTSLLGEGWDAPSINSLILASFVGSYVLSNQMRGRAIRTEQNNRNKTSNIWHLVCADPTANDGGDDIQLLKRRFKAFVGVSFHEELTIENGINRLNLPDKITSEEDINQINKRIFYYAGRRNQLKKKWHKALKSGSILIEEIKIPFDKNTNYKEVKSLYYNKTIKYILGALGSGLIGFGFDSLKGLLRNIKNIKTSEDLLKWLMITGIIGILLFGRLAYKTVKVYIKYRDISKDIQNIGLSLLQSLIKIGTIKTEYSKLKVISNVDDYGAIYCHLEGGSTYEKSIFIKSLQEIISTVNNPRYLIIRKSFFLNVLSQKDYHAVPEIIGRKKLFSIYFENQWKQYVGACKLVYTRTIEGRKLLLKSRIKSLAAKFDNPTERINKWR